MAKTKIKRKPSPQVTDPVDQKSKFQQILFKYKTLFTYLGVIIIVGIALSVLMIFNQRQKEYDASSQLQSVISLYSRTFSAQPQQEQDGEESATNDIETVIGKCAEISDNYPDTNASQQALFLKASASLNSGDNQSAILAYNQYIEANPDSLLVPGAMLGLATAQMNSNALDASIDTLNKLLREYPDFQLMDVVKYELGKRFEAKSSWKEAEDYYTAVIENFPDSPWKYTAQQRKNEIDRKHPDISGSNDSKESNLVSG
ncbi:tetratricopeptide repeat protein [bacterium]|nr:tetratricopeptide repeat protein [candidate division CSSED10-310 bacterium]